MKKKILSIALILALVFSFSSVFATETAGNVTVNEVTEDAELTTNATLEDLTNTVLVDGDDEIPDLSEELETLLVATPGSGDTVYEGGRNRFIADEEVSLKDTTIAGNLIIFAQDVKLSNVTVDGDVVVFAQDIDVSTMYVYSGATILAGEKITLDNYATEGNIYAAAERINAKVDARDLYVAAGNIDIAQASQIRTVYNLSEYLPEEEQAEIVVRTTGDIIKDKVFAILAIVVKTLFVCGFIFLFVPEFVSKIKTDNIVKYIGFSALKGAGWTILIPIIVIALCCTGIAIGVAFATLALYIIIFWSSVPFVSLAIMNVVAKEDDTKWKKFGISLCVAFAIAVLGAIPGIGGLITILVGFSGMGIVMGSLRCSCGCKKECKKAEVKEEKVEEAKPEEKIEEVKEDKTEEDK